MSGVSGPRLVVLETTGIVAKYQIGVPLDLRMERTAFRGRSEGNGDQRGNDQRGSDDKVACRSRHTISPFINGGSRDQANDCLRHDISVFVVLSGIIFP